MTVDASKYTDMQMRLEVNGMKRNVEIPQELLDFVEHARKCMREGRESSKRTRYYSPNIFKIDSSLADERFGLK